MLYGVQMTLAYLLMLVAMLYEVVLFVALIAGLTLGHLVLNPAQDLHPYAPAAGTESAATARTSHCSCSCPCCGGAQVM